jgi:hypothetical protein
MTRGQCPLRGLLAFLRPVCSARFLRGPTGGHQWGEMGRTAPDPAWLCGVRESPPLRENVLGHCFSRIFFPARL